MLEVLQSPYTPIFPSPPPPPPPPPPNPDSPASILCDSALTMSNGLNKTSQKPYIDRLKERYLLLSGLPEELCPPSRETSPDAETRVEALSLRMRNAHELRLPLELVLTCVGVKGGDWMGVPLPGENEDERQYCLPATEEEWFEWESARNRERDVKKAERKETECRQKIEKWSQGVQEDSYVGRHQIPSTLQERSHLAANGLDYLDLKVDDDCDDPCIATRIPSEECPIQLLREQSEPVERNFSPLPSAAADLVHGFHDSFSPPGSIPLSSDLKPKSPTPDDYDLPLSPSFAVGDINTSTPRKKLNSGPILQLSSPISPPRGLRPLMASQMSIIPTSLKRSRSDEVDAVYLADGVIQASSTPYSLKRARDIVQPITPKSVERPRGSQEFNSDQEPRQLPTLDDLLDRSARKASSRKGAPRERLLQGRLVDSRRKSSPPQHIHSSPHPEVSSSQPIYSMFRPQFQPTQHRRSSLPPSPTRPLTSTQHISNPKMPCGTASSGIGSFQSQFDIERRIDQVTTFLDADAWELK